MSRTGGQLLVDGLKAHGVRTVFAVPGVQLDDVVDALYEARHEVHLVSVRNEQATTYMADGYARSTGEVGVAMAVPGPGVLNALAGLATAYACSSPVLLIAGQIDSAGIGRGLGALHEIPDQSGIVASLSKWSALARSPEQIPDLLGRAFVELRSGRPRPVVLEVPPDVLAATADVRVETGVAPAPQLDQQQVRAAAAVLSAARAPVIVAGGGVLASGASAELTALAELLQAPVVVTDNGRGAISGRHPLALDPLAMRYLRGGADVVLAVGTRFVTAFGEQVPAGNARLVLLNAEGADFGEPRRPEVVVHCDARAGLAALAAELAPLGRPSGAARAAAARTWCEDQFAAVAPQRAYLSAIRAALPEEGVFVSEFTQVGYVAGMCFPTYQPRTFIGPGYQGTLGYGFATALGAKVADPARAVVSVTGDGGFGWTMPELSTAKKYGIGLVTVVFNDGYFGNVRRMQRDNFGGRFMGSDLVNPDYAVLAEAFGVLSLRAESPHELEKAVTVALDAGEPVLIDAPVGEFPSPWPLIHERARR